MKASMSVFHGLICYVSLRTRNPEQVSCVHVSLMSVYPRHWYHVVFQSDAALIPTQVPFH